MKMDGVSSSAVCEEKINNISNFYLSNSWMCPGQKDKFIIRKPGQEKKTVQKQYMLTTLREAHAMYKNENPGEYMFLKVC